MLAGTYNFSYFWLSFLLWRVPKSPGLTAVPDPETLPGAKLGRGCLCIAYLCGMHPLINRSGSFSCNDPICVRCSQSASRSKLRFSPLKLNNTLGERAAGERSAESTVPCRRSAPRPGPQESEVPGQANPASGYSLLTFSFPFRL